MSDPKNLLSGFLKYKGEGTLAPLKEGQRPNVMIIACADSRVDPAILTGAGLGELFMVRNVANLVPPHTAEAGAHGVGAALEFAICSLGVRHVIVKGHAQCGGIKALMAESEEEQGGPWVRDWLSIVQPVRRQTLEEHPNPGPDRLKAAERASILHSLENLRTYPFIEERLRSGDLQIHGLYFDLESGEMLAYDPETQKFE